MFSTQMFYDMNKWHHTSYNVTSLVCPIKLDPVRKPWMYVRGFQIDNILFQRDFKFLNFKWQVILHPYFINNQLAGQNFIIEAALEKAEYRLIDTP